MNQHFDQTERGDSAASLVTGFVTALFLTVLAYEIAMYHILSGWSFMIWILILAVAQLGVQLLYFLRLGRGAKSSWKLILLSVTAFIVCVIVAGSLWIMGNLNTRMTPDQMNAYMVNEDSL